jgi:hypothetical protein
MAGNNDKEAFWNNKHSKNDKYWLSGSPPNRVINQHNVEPEFEACTSFLDIGVGMGSMIRYVKSKQKKVYACDISQVALDRIGGIADGVSIDLTTLPPVDLAVCHLVLQHCDDETFTKIINGVRLNPGGVLTFQFACLRPEERPNRRVKELIDSGTHYLRGLDEVKRIIESSTNKKLHFVSKPIEHRSGENLRWYFCKVKNR